MRDGMNQGWDTDRWAIPKFAWASEAISFFKLINGRIIREHELTMNLFRIDVIHIYCGRVTLQQCTWECKTKIYVEVSVENNKNIDFYCSVG